MVSSFHHCQHDVSFLHIVDIHTIMSCKMFIFRNKSIKREMLHLKTYHRQPSIVAMIEPSISPRRNCSWFGLDILPLFHEKAATPDMIRHGVELIKKITVDLSPTQIPEMTMSASLRPGKEESVDLP